MQLIKPSLRNLTNLTGYRTNYVPILKLSESLCHKTILAEQKVQGRQFHITSSRRTLNPIDSEVARCITTVAVILSGRLVRWQWKRLSPEKKSVYISKIKRLKYIFLATGIFAFSQLWLFYNSHLQLNKITGKKQFILYTKDQIQNLAEDIFIQELKSYRKTNLYSSSPNHHRAEYVLRQLITRNNDIDGVKDINWVISVLDIPYFPPALLFPGGHIFVSSSLVDFCENDDQLSIVISHEMAHEILNHMIEDISIGIFLDMIHVLILLFIWTFMPVFGAAIMHYVSRKCMRLLFDLPMKRIQELDADKIGLFLSAKACYDVREVIQLWINLQKKFHEEHSYYWNSTHPNAEQRKALFAAILPQAVQLREDCDCPDLPPDICDDSNEDRK